MDDEERQYCAVGSCRAPYHPATGHILAPGLVLCGPCARQMVKFVKGHTQRKWGGKDFYAEAATSIKAK